MPSSPPVMQVSVAHRHAAVRQSSLLRKMHNAGSQPSTASKSSSDDSGLREDGEEKDGEERDESEVGLTTSCSPPQPRQGHTGLAVRRTRTSSQELIPRLLQASQAVDKAAVSSLCNFPTIPTDRYSCPRNNHHNNATPFSMASLHHLYRIQKYLLH
jgi:hypothetical protein